MNSHAEPRKCCGRHAVCECECRLPESEVAFLQDKPELIGSITHLVGTLVGLMELGVRSEIQIDATRLPIEVALEISQIAARCNWKLLSTPEKLFLSL